MAKKPEKLLLASSSRYRKRLLERLNLPFESYDPAVDETPLEREPAAALATRLAIAKAQAVDHASYPGDILIIGSDQVASCAGLLLNKPGTTARAIQQLQHCSGQTVTFYTGLALWRPDTGQLSQDVVTTEVLFRHLSREEVEAYVAADLPLDCAGSFKWEALGISLFSALRSDDPSSLEGLPLITLCARLRAHGYRLP